MQDDTMGHKLPDTPNKTLYETQEIESHPLFLEALKLPDPLTLRRWLQSQHLELRPTTVKKYKKIGRQIFRKRRVALRSLASLRLTRSALNYILIDAVLRLDGCDVEKLKEKTGFWTDFAKAVTTEVEISGEHVCQHQGFLRLAVYLQNRKVEVDGPRSPTFGKRRGRVQRLRKLCIGWREIFFENIDTQIPRMRGALITLALTGCRPSELSSATFTHAEAGHVTIQITSGKALGGDQPVVRGGVYVVKGIVGELISLFRSHDAEAEFPFEHINPKQIENILARTSNKKKVLEAIGSKICASDFRNQSASDAKASGFSEEELALLLGHSTNLEQRTYGRASLGAARGEGWLPCRVIESHSVRMLEKRYGRAQVKSLRPSNPQRNS